MKSSKSSNSIFGSCLSTTDTIGSFRTAFSGSLSTLYFSAKSNCEDGVSTTDTLNWTMNGSTYDNFDELSDTSTLVGCEDLAASLDQVQNNRYLHYLGRILSQIGLNFANLTYYTK